MRLDITSEQKSSPLQIWRSIKEFLNELHQYSMGTILYNLKFEPKINILIMNKENQLKIKPPVPKFDLSKLDNIKPPDAVPSHKSDKRRLKEVVHYIETKVQTLPIQPYREHILSLSIKMLRGDLLESLKSKKYSSIGNALIAHSARILLLPITTRQLLSELEANEKQVHKVLSILQNRYPYKRDDYVLSFVKKVCGQMGLAFKFEQVCAIIYDILNYFNLIHGEHEHIISAAVVKLAGDVLFADKGGLNPLKIINAAGCCEISLKNFLKKSEPRFEDMGTKLRQELSSCKF